MEKYNPDSERDKDAKSATERADDISEQYSDQTEPGAGSGMVEGVANIATDLVHGVGAIGGEVVTVVRDTANSALAGVGSVGETAVHTVTSLMASLVSGLRDIGSAATRGRMSSGLTNEIGREGHEEEVRRRQEEIMH